ncbi:uncharacterized protein LOC133204303 [Saccostrea echinata]|uniref:uncharacterized protein LOC133204303 n=1 Tax=Saccostrea echinata TaxID=191078 RepID=UPI002A80FC3D|nr:uncharacterized protein LOC133204303 [Saccostrea echinata]
MPILFILGVCTEYNILGERIQDLHSVRCTNHSPPCPPIYPSTDAYKYDSCYKLVYDKRGKSTSQGPASYETTNTDLELTTLSIVFNSESGTREMLIGIIVVLAVFIVILATAVIHMYLRIYTRPIGKKYDNAAEHEEMTMMLKGNVLVSCMNTLERKAEENLDNTQKYLHEYRTFDKYFVETRIFKKIRHLLNKTGVAIISGPPGCGKTNAAIHLLLDKDYAEWDKRKIHNSEELSFILPNKNTLVFIDNLFQDTSSVHNVEQWWKELDKIFDISIKMFRGKDGIHKGGRVRLLITARENVIENACKYMKNVIPVLNENSIVRVINEWCDDEEESIDTRSIFPLQKKEREEILFSQFEFAEKAFQVENKKIEKSVLQGIIESNGPLGFPLCAHLFACKVDYRIKGTTFFSDPTDYMKIEIENEISNDRSNRTKTLLFTMFVFEWHIKNKESYDQLMINNEAFCRNFLKGVSGELLSKFEPFEFTDLTIVAKQLCGAFLIENEDGIFRFTHESVFEAVASYFCDRYFAQAADNFPLSVLENQESSLENEDRRRMLALRLLYEIFNRKISEVFLYKAFSVPSFVDCFFEQLQKRVDRVIKKFFDSTDDSSDLPLPPSFWAGKANLYYLTEKMLKLAQEKGIKHDYHLCMTLLGECCSVDKGLLKEKYEKYCDILEILKSEETGECSSVDEGLMKEKHEKYYIALEKLKSEITNLKNENMDSILHLVIKSSRSDEHICKIIRHLTEKTSMNINERNKQNMTPIMSALECSNPRIEWSDKRTYSTGSRN